MHTHAPTPPPAHPIGGSTPPVDWHRRSADEVLAGLGSSTGGLTDAEARRRRHRDGPNELTEQGGKHPLRLLLHQLTAVMVLILVGAALLSALLGKYLEAGAIGAIVVLFAVLGFVQEYRAERAIAALRRLASPTVRVWRDGDPLEIPIADVVVGDLVGLEAGAVVPADLRLLETASLRVQESALTGESEPVDKEVAPITTDATALGDRRNMAYAGTQVTAGRGRGVVTATGMGTELGRIARLLQSVTEERTPLQARLDAVGTQLAVVGAAVALAVVALGALGGESVAELVLTAISVAVAVIPEGLPAVVTVTLAIGAQRMLRREALIRRLPAVETLGSVTTICSDKTGTLTQNRMTVVRIEADGVAVEPDAEGRLPISGRLDDTTALVAAVLCNDAEITSGAEGQAALLGDPTETALVQAALDAGLDVQDLPRRLPRLAERPFDSVRKRMSTVHPDPASVPGVGAFGGGPVAFVKGSPDGMLDHSTHVLEAGVTAPMTAERRQRLVRANDELAARGMRVLAVAARRLDAPDDADLEHDLTFLGLVAMIDPPRPEVREAVATCREAGIRPVMITGDHPLTALAIARDLGIADATTRAVTGADLDVASDVELDRLVTETSVFARVSPEHKLRIVASLQAGGEVVAMTGDGVNDAPALKRADIGVAMGITGTDVSKEASDMVLRDDNFATIVAAVEEGRVIFDNLRRFVSFAVAGNLGKILVMLGWPVVYLLAGGDTGEAVALVPLQLLWLNLMTDGVLGLAMGTEPAERSVMQRPPQRPGSSLWSGGLGGQTLVLGLVIGAVALGFGVAYHQAGRPEWQTMMFTSIAFLQVAQAIGTRSRRDSLRTIGLLSNRPAVVAVAVVVALQLAAVLTPLRNFLDLTPLGVDDLAWCGLAALGLLAAIEGVKFRHRRRAG